MDTEQFEVVSANIFGIRSFLHRLSELPSFTNEGKDMETKRHLTEGFHRLSQHERLERVKELCELTSEDLNILSGQTPHPPEVSEHLIENVLGYFPIPLGVATNFTIDGRDLLIPMAVEETSI